MAFFRNDTVNLLNLHYGIHSLALSGGGAFFAAFLLYADVPAPAVLASLAAILAGRFVIRPFVLVPARRWGLKPLVIAGTVMTGLQYPLLAEVHGVEWKLCCSMRDFVGRRHRLLDVLPRLLRLAGRRRASRPSARRARGDRRAWWASSGRLPPAGR